MAHLTQSIRHRFILLIVLVAVPLAAFDVYQSTQEKQRRVAEFSAGLIRTTHTVVEKISGLIDASQELLITLSSVEEVTNGDIGACTRLLHDIGGKYPKYTNFSMVNRDKYLVCSSGPLAKPIHLTKSPNINEAFARKEFAVSPFKFGVLTGKPILVFSQPFFDRRGAVKGTVNNGLSLTWLGGYFATIDKLTSQRIVVFDGDGTVLATFPENLFAVGSSINGTNLVRRAVEIQNGGGTFVDSNDEKMVSAFVTIPRIPNGAYVASFAPEAELHSHILDNLYKRLIVLGVLVAGSLLLGWGGARILLINPINRLVDLSGALARGDLKARSDVSDSSGELGRLSRAFDQMAEALDVRTQALAQARDEAEKASKAKSEFLASMSHELRTPLNAVLGFAQMLQYDPHHPLSPAQRRHTESILEGGQHLLELINEILDLAKVEANQLDLTLSEVNANDVIADCVNLISPLGEPRGINIVNHCGDKPSSLLRTDQVRMKQALINLLSNAIKFNKTNGTVTVDCAETDDGFLRISITDTGIGITPDDRESVFYLFHRLGADPMVSREGTGIGLTVTKQLLDRMAGSIGFDSEDGVGSTFWFELPLVSNRDVLIWTEAMRIGIDPLDKDHQVIAALLNKLAHQSVDEANIDSFIQDLVNYTQYHFRREEAIMKACDYPKLAEHVQRHGELAGKVKDLANEWKKFRSPELLHPLHDFLQDMLFTDILDSDTDIALYAKGKEQEIEKAMAALAKA